MARTLKLIGIFLLDLLIVSALIVVLHASAHPQKTSSTEYPVVFQFDHREKVDGVFIDVVTIPGDQYVVLGLVPIDGQGATLSPRDWLICKSISMDIKIEIEGKDPLPSHEIGFNCGGKRWIFTYLSINSTKKGAK